MKSIFRKMIAFLMMLLLVATMMPAAVFAAGEDTAAPLLKSAQFTTQEVKAGENIKLKLGVNESETGLKKVFIQLNHPSPNAPAILLEKELEKPVYSSEKGLAYLTLEIPTTKDTRNGDWFISYIELYDAKGNFSRFFGKKGSNQLNSEFVEPAYSITSSQAQINIYGATGDFTEPMLNWAKVTQSSVEKPGTATFKLNITEDSDFRDVQFTFIREGEYLRFTKTFNDISWQGDTATYTFEIPISDKLRNGTWKIQHIYLTDEKENSAHYTSEGYGNNIVNYYTEEVIGAVPRFEITGAEPDATEPESVSLTVLNPGKTLQKPGMLEVELELKEEESGVTDVCFLVNHLASKSQTGVFYEFSAKDYIVGEKTGTFDQPLKSGKYKFKIPISSVMQNGEYFVAVCLLRDKEQNVYENYYYPDLVQDKFTVSDEFDYAFEVSITNSSLLSKVQEMEEGKAGRILLSSSRKYNVLPKNVLNVIAGRDKTLVCYRDGYQWIINGLDIAHNKTKALNLTAEFSDVSMEMLESNQKVKMISFEDNGELPGVMQFRFKTAFVKNYVGREDDLSLYYVNEYDSEQEGLDFYRDDYEKIPGKKSNIQVVPDDDDTWCYVDISHNSKYLLSKSALSKLSMKKAVVSGLKSSYLYTGSSIKPALTVKLGGKTLKLNTDYKLTYKNNTAVGTASATITGIGKYKTYGSKTLTFKITRSMLNAQVSGYKGSYLYTGSSIKPAPTVKLDGKTLKLNSDYTLTYKNNKNVGTATVTITGIGKYKAYGKKSITFKIARSMVNAQVSGYKSSYPYTGKAINPKLTVKMSGKTLKLNTDYKLTYKNNKNVGTASVTITGIGKYKTYGSKKITFKINPKGVSISKLSGASKRMTVKWNKRTAQTSGYQIQYSRSSEMKSAETVTVSKNTTTSGTIKKLAAGKKYYVRIRTYKTVAGKKYYSGWSKIKSVKTK